VSLQELEHIGAVLRGHFLLTSGRHSDLYFEKFRLLEQPALLERLVGAVLASLPREAVAAAQAVVGPTLGGVIVAYEAARQLGVRALYAEREGDGRAFRRGSMLEPEHARAGRGRCADDGNLHPGGAGAAGATIGRGWWGSAC
jgi:orotate phosphoribosyltransferase